MNFLKRLSIKDNYYSRVALAGRLSLNFRFGKIFSPVAAQVTNNFFSSIFV